MTDPQFIPWNEKLDGLLESAKKDCSLESPILLETLAKAALKGASASWRTTLAEKRTMDELGRKLRKPSTENKHMVPNQLNMFAEIDGGYVHMSQLPRVEILHRRNKLQQTVRTSLIKIAAYDEMLQQNLPSEGGIGA
jgi:hypothetical protein